MSIKTQNAIVPARAENFPEWYQQVIKAADMAENAPVRGCMIIKPYGYALWENVQSILGGMIKERGVQNAYFPLLIPLSYLNKEAEHIDGFAKECAVVTHHRLEKGPDGNLIPASPLTEPLIIRPTSETIIGEVISGWVKSYRDLPLKLNQWCNVMRWEMRPRMFLRTSEFLWQEGHNCFANAEEANKDALDMLDMYVNFLQEYMAIPGIKGEKTADEKFPGADATYTYEAMMQDGKAVQMCTSHNLGQTFSKSANIQFQNSDGQSCFAYTTSWGLSTRTIGALIMSHADDDGLIMPPRIAPQQVCIIPIFRDKNQEAIVLEKATQIKLALKAIGIRCEVDMTDDKSSNKVWKAIKKGIPIRIELGNREVENNQLTYSRRDQERQIKTSCAVEEFIKTADSILGQIHQNIYDKAERILTESIVVLDNIHDIRDFFASKNKGFVSVATGLLSQKELADIKSEYSVTPRCLPFSSVGKNIILGLSY
jgi:prolyl-tRNA synthetase